MNYQCNNTWMTKWAWNSNATFLHKPTSSSWTCHTVCLPFDGCLIQKLLQLQVTSVKAEFKRISKGQVTETLGLRTLRGSRACTSRGRGLGRPRREFSTRVIPMTTPLLGQWWPSLLQAAPSCLPTCPRKLYDAARSSHLCFLLSLGTGSSCPAAPGLSFPTNNENSQVRFQDYFRIKRNTVCNILPNTAHGYYSVNVRGIIRNFFPLETISVPYKSEDSVFPAPPENKAHSRNVFLLFLP